MVAFYRYFGQLWFECNNDIYILNGAVRERDLNQKPEKICLVCLFECRVGLRIFQGFNLPRFFSVFFRGSFPHVLHVIKAEWLWVKKNSRSLFNYEKVKIKNLFVLLRATKNSTNISAKNRRFLDGEFVDNNKTPGLICLLLCLLFTVPLENILVIRWRHNCRWKAKNLCRYLVRLLNREGCLSCHTCCDRGSVFRGLIRTLVPVLSPGTTRKGWRGSILARVLIGSLGVARRRNIQVLEHEVTCSVSLTE